MTDNSLCGLVLDSGGGLEQQHSVSTYLYTPSPPYLPLFHQKTWAASCCRQGHFGMGFVRQAFSVHAHLSTHLMPSVPPFTISDRQHFLWDTWDSSYLLQASCPSSCCPAGCLSVTSRARRCLVSCYWHAVPLCSIFPEPSLPVYIVNSLAFFFCCFYNCSRHLPAP